jgi:carbohydrate kinase (thermoresistant glucokinase family)
VIIVVMGVSGAGKSTLGAALAQRLGWRFLEGDDFHPRANVAKMAAGKPLTDADRAPWLERLNIELRAVEAKRESAVLACSALKRAYREHLAAGIAHCTWVYLRGSIDLIRRRLGARRHRYMPASLLESQFAALEPPEDAIAIDVGPDIPACVDAILARMPA